MDEYFGTRPVSNAVNLCVGGITKSESARAQESGIDNDGTGYYLYLANQLDFTKPIEVLARFESVSAAEKLARLMRAD